jgi:AraC-like DNA-binding protein
MLRSEVLESNIRISTTMVQVLLNYLDGLGFSENEILDACNIPFEKVRHGDDNISERDFENLYQKCMSLSNDPFLGLHIGAKISLRQLGVLGYLLMNCDTFGSALHTYVKFQQVLGDGILFKLENRSSSLRVYFDLFGNEKYLQHRLETVLSGLRAITKELTGKELIYEKINFTFQPRSPFVEYLRHLGMIPESAISNYIEFSAAQLKNPVLNSFPELRLVLEAQLITKMDSNLTFSKKVRRELLLRIGKTSDRSVEALSLFFGMSERSFQMKLEQEKTSFRQIHDEVQLRFAENYLKEGSTISEIAFALGFSEPSAFQRAYKRWTGRTPGKSR